MKFTTSTAVSLAALSMGAAAIPMRRQDTSGDTKKIADLMGSAIAQVLQGQSVTDNFRIIKGGRQVTWVGTDPKNDVNFGNSILFGIADNVAPISDNATESNFADSYKNFVQDVNKALNLNDTEDSQELQDAATKRDDLCGTKLLEVQLNITEQQTALLGKLNKTGTPSQAQIDQKVRSSAVWKTANADCTKADNEYAAKYDDEHGNNFALFAQALKNIRPIADSTTTVAEGVTMPADSQAYEDNFSTGTPSGQGNVLPLYVIPGLNGTIQGWEAKPADAKPEFQWDSTTSKTHTEKELSEGSASAGVSFGRFGAHASSSHSDSEEKNNVEVQSFKVSFAGIGLHDVQTGLWFDGYRMARQCEDPKDEQTAACKKPFDTHFGTKEKPGQAARYNRQALVGYKMTWEMSFASEDEAKKFSESSFDVGANYLFFDASASGKKMSEVSDLKVVGKTASYTSTGPPLILGFVTGNYFSGNTANTTQNA